MATTGQIEPPEGMGARQSSGVPKTTHEAKIIAMPSAAMSPPKTERRNRRAMRGEGYRCPRADVKLVAAAAAGGSLTAMPSASFAHAVSIDRPIAEVWTTLMVPETWANIGPVDEVWDPEFDGDTLIGYRWSTNVGGKAFRGTAMAVGHEAPTSYVVDLDAGEMAGRITIELSTRSPDTAMTVRLDFRTKGMLSSMFFPLIRDAIGSGFPKQIEDFAASFD